MLLIPGVEGGASLRLGRCYNQENGYPGPDIFNPDSIRSQPKGQLYFEYKQVKSPQESRAFLGVSDRTILKVKAGLLTPDGAAEYLSKPPPEGAGEGFTEILVRLRYEHVVESVAREKVSIRVYQLPDSELTQYTHFIQRVTYGGELIANVSFNTSESTEYRQEVHNTGGPVPELGTLPQQLREDLERLGAVVSASPGAGSSTLNITCYSTGCEVAQVTGVQGLIDLLHQFPGKVQAQGKGAVLKYELQLLNNISGLEDKIPPFIERELVGSPAQLKALEEEFDDLCGAESVLTTYWDQHETEVESKPEFSTELERFDEKLSTVKQMYTDFISLVLDRCRREDEFNRSLKNVQDKYKKVHMGKAKFKFTRKIHAIIDTHVPTFKPNEYVVLTEEEWKSKKDEGYPEHLIKKIDLEKKAEIDSFLRRGILAKNTVEYVRSRCRWVSQNPELRVVLVGKTGVGKSATGNLLMGEKVFDEAKGPHSVTEVIRHKILYLADRTIRIVDTPGLFDTKISEDKVLLELAKTLETFPNGVHAFIYVLNSAHSRFTKEEQETLQKIKKHFGDGVVEHTAVILTHADASFKDTSLGDYLGGLPDTRSKDPETPADGATSGSDSTSSAISMKKFLVEDVRGHVMAVNNKYRCEYERIKQRDAIVELVDVVQTQNGGECFKNKYFDKAKKRLQEREKEEDKARERLLEQEVAENHDAVEKARSLADHFSDAYLRNLQLLGMKAEIKSDFRTMTRCLESQVKELKEGIGVLLELYDLPGDPFQNFLRALVKSTVVEAGKLRLIETTEQHIFDIMEEAGKRRQDQLEKQEEQKQKDEAVKWNPKEWYGVYKDKKAMKAKFETLKREETEKVKGHQQTIESIRSNMCTKLLALEKQMKEDKAKAMQAVRDKSRDSQEFELAVEYLIQTVSLISNIIITQLETEDLQVKDADEYIQERNVVEEQLKSHLVAMRENIEMMMIFEARIEESAALKESPVHTVVEEVINRAASLVVAEISDAETKKELGNIRVEWQMKALQHAKESRGVTSGEREVSIEQYETAFTYAQLWSLYVAEDIIRKKNLIEVESLRKEILDNVYTDDLTSTMTQVEEGLRFQLDMAGKGQETLAILSKVTNEEGKSYVLNRLAKHSTIEAVFFSTIEREKIPERRVALDNARKAYRLNTITKANDIYQNNKMERLGYDLAKMYTTHASEYLADRYLRYIRLEEIRREDEVNFQQAMTHVSEKLSQELEKRDAAAFSYFQRFVTPDGRLSSVERIARNSIQQIGKMMLLQPRNSIDHRSKMEDLKEDWTNHVKNEQKEHEIYLDGLVGSLTACVRDLAPEYAKSKDITQLEKIKANGYRETIADLTPQVLDQLPDDAKTYFDEEKIGKAIRIYTELNEESLRQLAKDVKCFPACVTVTEATRGDVKIGDVRVGDRIMTSCPDGSVQYQDVFMLGHADALTTHTYLKVTTEDGNHIMLSREHLLPVGCCDTLIPARDLMPGDQVFVVSDGRLKESRVTSVETVIEHGAYCPHTTGGSLVVNRVLASCYTDVIPHQVAHSMLLPARMLYQWLPSGVFRWLFPYDDEQGMPTLLLQLKNMWTS